MNIKKAKDSIEKVAIEFQLREPFYGSIFRRLRKVYLVEIETIGLFFNGINFELGINPDYINKLSYNHIKSTCEHILLHICFKHMINADKKDISEVKAYNIAADLEVNQKVKDLPKNALRIEDVFGLRNEKILQQREAEYYFSKFSKDIDVDSIDTLDNHNFWFGSYSIEDIMKDLAEKAESLDKDSDYEFDPDMEIGEDDPSISDQDVSLEYMLQKAEEESDGELPRSLPTDYIRKIFVEKDEINANKDWYKILRKYLNQLLYKSSFTHYELKRSFRRPNKKLGFPFPSVKVDPLPILNVAVCIDGSGSINNRTFDEFMCEINCLFNREIKLTLIGFDFEVKEENIIRNYNPFQWIQAKKIENLFPGELGGGTDFVPAVEIARKSRPKPDCILMFTDSYDKGNLLEPEIPMIFILSEENENFYDWARCVNMY